MKFRYIYFIIIVAVLFSACKKEQEIRPPEIYILSGAQYNSDGDTLEIGEKISFGIRTVSENTNITNFTIKLTSDGITRTLLDSGLYSKGFNIEKTFYQGIEDHAVWTFSVMDRNRQKASVSLSLIKDPNSTFGGIYIYPSVTLGMQANTVHPHFFCASGGRTFSSDSAAQNQYLVDVLAYFKYSADNGIDLPSPTFSSPGEDINGIGELYDLFYPELTGWTTRNYTKYDIRSDNGVSLTEFNDAHNDSLLIVSYDDVWGKKKYKWAMDGTIIPFQTAAGKKGLIYVIHADTVETGIITFSMKVQM